jgi:hypothetical protein
MDGSACRRRKQARPAYPLSGGAAGSGGSGGAGGLTHSSAVGGLSSPAPAPSRRRPRKRASGAGLYWPDASQVIRACKLDLLVLLVLPGLLDREVLDDGLRDVVCRRHRLDLVAARIRRLPEWNRHVAIGVAIKERYYRALVPQCDLEVWVGHVDPHRHPAVSDDDPNRKGDNDPAVITVGRPRGTDHPGTRCRGGQGRQGERYQPREANDPALLQVPRQLYEHLLGVR